MDNLLDSSWLVPFMFFAGLTVVILDGVRLELHLPHCATLLKYSPADRLHEQGR